MEDIEAADVLPLSGDLAQTSVHLARIGLGELSNAPDSQQLEITKHGRTDGDQILEAMSFLLGRNCG
jgi:hypothetical protein